jgi:methionyl-tRNA synthetase
MSSKRFLVTSGLPYSNGLLHVGHIAGAYLPADTYVRYLRSRGEDVRFICGSDDNGVASLISARKENTTVEELTTRYNARQASAFKGMGIEFDIFGGTHQPGFVEMHEKICQEIFLEIHRNGYFVKKTTEQLYDTQADQFLPDRYVKGTCYHRAADGTPCGSTEAFGDQCEACGNTIEPLELTDPVSTITGSRPEKRSTTLWYLQLQRLEKDLGEWLTAKRDTEPAWRNWILNFVLGQIKNGLPERAMTRDLTWGVPIPLDDPDAAGKALYVWFDAPIGYISFTASLCQAQEGDWRGYERWWKDPDCKILHFIGEDNIVFHALTWPAMLLAEGSYQLPEQVVANAFLNIKFPGQEEQKVSKSRGTAIWIDDYLKSFDPDPLRYYLTAVAPEKRRTPFNAEDFITRNNGELLNALGNFINRTLTFVQRYFDGRVPAQGQREPVDQQQLALIASQAELVTAHLDRFQFKAALAEVMALSRAANGYLDTKQPWRQRKEDMAACGTTMNVCVQTVKAVATLMAPFLPFSAETCVSMLKAPGDTLPWLEATVELPEAHQLGEPVILFKKLEIEDLIG